MLKVRPSVVMHRPDITLSGYFITTVATGHAQAGAAIGQLEYMQKGEWSKTGPLEDFAKTVGKVNDAMLILIQLLRWCVVVRACSTRCTANNCPITMPTARPPARPPALPPTHPPTHPLHPPTPGPFIIHVYTHAIPMFPAGARVCGLRETS